MLGHVSAAVLIPVKAFHLAKARLAGTLAPAERASLARAMASLVLAAAAPLPVYVVCDDEEVARWAGSGGAHVVWRPGHGLNGAVTSGVAALADVGFTSAVVAHSDLPLAVQLDRLVAGPGGVLLVPDRREDGTNVAVVPTDASFTFAYGPGSFHRHVAEAQRLGLAITVVREPDALGWDVDLPDDLDHPSLKGLLPSLPTNPASHP